MRLGRFLRVIRLALLAHHSLGHVAFRGLVPKGPPEGDSILKPPPNSIRDSSQDGESGGSGKHRSDLLPRGP